jgi:hypothetical protein
MPPIWPANIRWLTSLWNSSQQHGMLFTGQRNLSLTNRNFHPEGETLTRTGVDSI